MKNNLFFWFLFLFFSQPNIKAQIEKVIVETYYISDKFDSTDVIAGKLDTGSVTYRVYVDLKPGNKLRKIYGDKNHALKFSSTKPFFNNLDGETFAKDLKRGIYNQGTVALDTWLTIGQTVARTNDGKANFGILKNQDSNGSFIGGTPNDGGSASIPRGLLTNTAPAMGIPLTTADGMFPITLPTYTWNSFFIKSFPSGIDSTIFGSKVLKSEFVSYKAFLENQQGVSGINADSNQVLIAQLTTKGQLTFELNLEIEQLENGLPVIFKYVANGDTLVGNEQVNSYLKYPYELICGCKDFAFLEYNAKFECSDASKCINRVSFGCKDSLACNFDPKANFSAPFLCCYPGRCGGREISNVCPDVMGNTFVYDIHPNPAQNTIFLNVTSGIEKEVSYAVYNYSGTKVLGKSLGIRQRVIGEEIDLSGLSGGLYLLRVSSGSDFLNKQFIKE